MTNRIQLQELSMKSAQIVALFALLAVSACETIKGAGRDISTGGQAVSTAAVEVQNEL